MAQAKNSAARYIFKKIKGIPKYFICEQTNRQTDKHTNRQTYKQTNRRTDKIPKIYLV